jgi:LPXTG-site transpeptidase (sortase) family protein
MAPNESRGGWSGRQPALRRDSDASPQAASSSGNADRASRLPREPRVPSVPPSAPRGAASNSVRSYSLRAERPERRSWLGNALLALGLLCLLAGGGTVAYASLAEWQHRAQRPAGPQETLASSLTLPVAGPSRGVLADPSAPVAAPQDPAGKPVWLKIPRISVDSSVMQMDIEGGEYQVPSFDVGHHADSANPGAPGNSVYNGHLETIDAGRVFARLREVVANDAIYVYTKTHRYDWVVEEVRTVPNNDTSFIAPSSDTRITVYTCAGSYDPRTRDYSHRLVVVGKLVQMTPRTDGASGPPAERPAAGTPQPTPTPSLPFR